MKKSLMLVTSWAVFLGILLLFAAAFCNLLWPRIFPLSVTLSYWLHNPQALTTLQYTHKGRKPENYVGIFGDSYAFGLGDGLLAIQTRYRPDYNVTHFLFQETGDDVISFGVPASSSIKGYLTDPAEQLAYAAESYFTAVDKPSYIVLYFYEGNDIEDNYIHAGKILAKAGYPDNRIGELAYSQDFFDKLVMPDIRLVDKNKRSVFSDIGRVLQFLKHAVLFVTGFDTLSHSFKAMANEPAPAGKVNQIYLAGKVVPIADSLQGPSMQLSDADTSLGFGIMERAIYLARKLYPAVPMIVVEIPAPATVYRFASAESALSDFDVGKLVPSAGIRPRSNMFCERAMAIAQRQGVLFHDARPALAARGETTVIHGPVDMLHPNLEGYRTLYGEVSKAVKALKLGDGAGLQPCVHLQ